MADGQASLMQSRREFLALVGGSAAALLACSGTSSAAPAEIIGGGSARLRARPGKPSGSILPGTIPVFPSSPDDAVILVPTGYNPAHPTPLVLALHGAGGSITGPTTLLRGYSEARAFLVLAVKSRGATWDAIRGQYGNDVSFIDSALAATFDRCNVDPSRVSVEGFSDGASYALGLGLANGDLFSRIVAFSPGFIPASDSPAVGLPAIFISHGKADPILPIDQSSGLIVPMLRQRGYYVNFNQFEGGHEAPSPMVELGVEFMVQ